MADPIALLGLLECGEEAIGGGIRGEKINRRSTSLFFPFLTLGVCIVQRWLTGARGKTLVREAELDRAENSGSGGDSREKASRGSARIEVWQDFLHTSEALLFLPS
ncbi:hypothetical protein Taro_030860 [Colocasia esculenta]|uniref:Uncharacterized protein n=1 Tax=Colocasia esculenta TaxID=4460 RepID=A0A843VMG9_COLES|nr:hypothetical protein [Colocasia esculenta]